MANAFKSVAVTLSDSTAAEVYTAPGSTTAVIHAVYLSNKHSSAINVDVDIRISSTDYSITQGAPIPAGSTLTLDKPINLETGEKLKVKSSHASGLLDVVLSVLQIT
jgi:hypothetical protein|tara:strand:- start:332 stop:652 length:321 start_codon:yes stop_codon:yes gene_type:complete